MFFKVLSGILAAVVVVLIVVFLFSSCEHKQERRKLKVEISKLNSLQKETESSYSILANEVEGIQAENKKLQEIINDRDEAILALAEANLKLKDRVVEIKNAKQVVVRADNPDVVVENDPCAKENVRYKVEFEKEEKPLKISGYTLTHPPFARVEIKWTEDLKLDLILTKDKDGMYRVYLDSESIVPTKLNLQVDPSILEYAWYQKISFGGSLAFGETGLLISVQSTYDVLPNLYIGPMFMLGYVSERAETFYGAVVGWSPWK